MATDAVEIRPWFNPYAEYLRASAPFLLPGAAVVFFYSQEEILGIERHIIFSGWQRFFPIFILMAAAFFILPGYVVALRRKDSLKTRYLITRREVDAYISHNGRLRHLLFTMGPGTEVIVRRSLIQRAVSTGDVILREGGSMLRIRDIRPYEEVKGILRKA